MAVKIYYKEDIQNGIVSELVAMLMAVLVSGGDVRRLGPSIAALQAQAMLYDLDWEEITKSVTKQIKSAAKRPLIQSKEVIHVSL